MGRESSRRRSSLTLLNQLDAQPFQDEDRAVTFQKFRYLNVELSCFLICRVLLDVIYSAATTSSSCRSSSNYLRVHSSFEQRIYDHWYLRREPRHSLIS